MKYLKGRWCILLNALWIGGWSTYIYQMDGNYPQPYMIWFSIITIVGLLIPWCFYEELVGTKLCRVCGGHVNPRSAYVIEYFKDKGDFYNHADCYLKKYGSPDKEIQRALNYVAEKEKQKHTD